MESLIIANGVGVIKMDKEYIERDAALEIALENWGGTSARMHISNGLKRLPAADVAPVVHGEWNVGSIGIHCYCECSICKQETPAGMETKFCPICGARMDGGSKNG